MKFVFTQRGLSDYEDLPRDVQAQVDKQLRHLLGDIRHPSLRAKKYGEAEDVWQARVNRDHRMYFVLIDDTYAIISIIKHPK